ncbi:aspartate ammonia-lyase [Neorhizobium sp. 2083]|uniref:aspartate ammonia-lyase n=1 Tax=Neorhizobium sp. 2083 TaxID=2817762 RepID=UPI00285CED9F|nr:lyase family protein [Neorhizobium sp. 2083]MDR6820988.1 aspartate ammonia-lyase [Neorhizobium sp. 2083]
MFLRNDQPMPITSTGKAEDPAQVSMRLEEDALGPRLIPDFVAYGIQTARAAENFSISGRTIADVEGFVPALLTIKLAAARANRKADDLDARLAHAIEVAAIEQLRGIRREDYPVDIYHGGGGTAANMNVNEVLANRASEILSGRKGADPVHPNTHVNMSQSTNDVIPAAMRIAIGAELAKLKDAISHLVEALVDKERELVEIVKLARTCLQDALPITFGQQFSGYRAAFERQSHELEAVETGCLGLPLGATAVGSGLGTSAEYRRLVYGELQELTGKSYHPEENLFDALQNADHWIRVSACLKAIAVTISKLSADLRFMSSGPRAGFGEISLPAVQPGSSIMPGKVNPVMPEMMMQVAFRVLGNDATVTRAAEGELDLNVWESIILEAISESIRLLRRGIPLFVDRCLSGVQANVDRGRADASGSLALSTALAAIYGYPAASEVVKHAALHGIAVGQAAVECGLMSRGESDRLFADVSVFADPDRSERLIAGFRNAISNLSLQQTSTDAGP